MRVCWGGRGERQVEEMCVSRMMRESFFGGGRAD